MLKPSLAKMKKAGRSCQKQTSAFWLPPSCEKTAATLFPLASRIAPRRFPAYPPTSNPGIFAMMKPSPAPKIAPSHVQKGTTRSTSGRRSCVFPKFDGGGYKYICNHYCAKFVIVVVKRTRQLSKFANMREGGKGEGTSMIRTSSKASPKTPSASGLCGGGAAPPAVAPEPAAAPANMFAKLAKKFAEEPGSVERSRELRAARRESYCARCVESERM